MLHSPRWPYPLVQRGKASSYLLGKLKPAMDAEPIIEHLKTLPAVERRAVLHFLQSDLKEESESKQAEDRKELKRLRVVF